jgi:transglutaminase-like putative cysteine protease
MPRAGINPQLSVERFFQLAVLGLVTSGYLAVAGSGYLDPATIVLTGLGLLLRGLLVTGLVRIEFSDNLIAIVTLVYIAFYPIDYFFVSHTFLQATVHLVFFLAVVKILSARSNRDYLYTAAIAFLEILAAAILSASLNFLFFLSIYLLCAIAAFTSAEIRRAMQKPQQIARSGLRRFHPRLVGLAAFVTFGILVLTGGLFFLLPRSANATLSHLVSHRIHVPGFSNEVTLGQIGEIKNDSSAVMHIRPDSAGFPDGLKWRGVGLSDFDGKRWSNPPIETKTARLENGWTLVTDRPRIGNRLFYHVTLNAVDSEALFVAGLPEQLRTEHPSTTASRRDFFREGENEVVRGPNDSLRLRFVPPDNFRYAVSSILEDGASVPEFSALSPDARRQYLRLQQIDPRVRELAEKVTAGWFTQFDRARALENYLRTSYGYTIELPDRETADPIAYFLFERKKGHCEYFASAMAVMLRAVGIPARLVNGFQSGTFNPISNQYVIRASDAHSWVEAYLESRGWTTFDPTPPDPSARPNVLFAKFALWTDAADTFWQDWVLRYDQGRQLILASQLQSSSRQLRMGWIENWSRSVLAWKSVLIAWISAHAPVLAILLALGAAMFLGGPRALRSLRMLHRVRRVRDGRASAGDATLLYERMLEVLRHRGFQKPAWFTPREFAASLPAETGMLVDQFTAAYNDLRFGGKLDAAPRLTLLLEELETGRTGIPAI